MSLFNVIKTAACSRHTECRSHLEMALQCPLAPKPYVSTDRYQPEVGTPIAMVRLEEEGTDYSESTKEPEAHAIGPQLEGHVYMKTIYATFTHIVEYSLCESYKGRVVNFGTDWNVRIMSDVWADLPYAIVEANGEFKKISLEGWKSNAAVFGYDHKWSVDAPDAMIDAWKAFEAKKLADAQEANAKAASERLAREEAAEAKEPRKGRQIKVVRGRKIPKGLVGECFWRGPGDYGDRVGFNVPGHQEPFWTSAKNCEAVA